MLEILLSIYSETSSFSDQGEHDAESSEFYPIPELRDTKSGLTLIFLSANGILFTEEVDDDWYSAHRPHKAPGSPYVMYLQDNPASVLACKWQDQWCNPNLPSDRQCTPLSGSSDTARAVWNISRNAEETELLSWIFFARVGMGLELNAIVDTLGISMLTSRGSMSAGMQGYIPNDQWQIDAEHWFSVYLASVQKGLVDYATGPSDPRVIPFLEKGLTQTCENAICRQQVNDFMLIVSLSLPFNANQCPHFLENPKYRVYEHLNLRPLRHNRRRQHHHHRFLQYRTATRVHS